MEHISSRQNALVKRLRELARARDESGATLLDGTHLLQDALAAGTRLELVAISSDAGADLRELAARASASGVRAVTLAPAVLDSVSPVRQPSGVLAIAHTADATLARVLAAAHPLVVLLDGVQDPGNVGAIIRAAEGCGATGVVVGDRCADPFGPKAMRGAMGSSLRLPVALAGSTIEALHAMKNAGLRTFATVPRDGTQLPHARLAGACGVLVGGEGTGLPDQVVRATDERLTIPMAPRVESLNVAIATALVLYEAARQRTHVAVR